MKILVFGNGFLGRPIVETLSAEGHELIVFSRTRKENLPCKQLIGDFLNKDFTFDFLYYEPQVVIHTGWITRHGIYSEDSSNLEYANFTSKLAFEVKKANVQHLIILGTCAEYGPRESAACAGVSELKPQTLYGKEKVRALLSSQKTLDDSMTRLTWARIFHPYGPGQDEHRLIPSIVTSLRSGSRINLRDSTTLNDWISTWDIASAISWLIRNDSPIEVDIGTSVGHTNEEIVLILSDLFGIKVLPKVNLGLLDNRNLMNVVSAKSPLLVGGWRPRLDLSAGLKQTFNL